MVYRETYIDKLKMLSGKKIIKVITGIRRSGKSELLKQFGKYLLSTGVTENQIIYLNFEDLSVEDLLEYRQLNKYIEDNLVPGKMTYIFLDEIQRVGEFEKVINSLQIKENKDIYHRVKFLSFVRRIGNILIGKVHRDKCITFFIFGVLFGIRGKREKRGFQ